MVDVGIDDLPQTVLEHIFCFLRPYNSLNNARQVNSKWRSIIDNLIQSMKRKYLMCNDFTWVEINEKLSYEGFLSYVCERGGHAACFSNSDNSMYIFGGCTSRYSPLSDLWKFDLDTLEWKRIPHQGDLPSARSLCSLVDCGEVLILFGGYARSSMNPINQNVQFFGDLFYYVKKQQKWIQVGPENSSIKALASHGASIIQNRWMIIYGGSSGEDYSGDVYVYDLYRQIWASVQCFGEPPSPRHGHCQVVVDNYNILIIGGAGVIRGVYSDIFLLTFEPCMFKATWNSIKVLNKELWPPHFWGVRGCRAGNKVVFLSRPQHYDSRMRAHRQRPTLDTAISVTSSSSSGQSRLSSPDSPQDRRAVAAAFSNATKENNLSESAALRRKSQFITSRSLDEQRANERNGLLNGINSVVGPQPMQLFCHNKSVELQRACSIPAIIVGEIPKLIITDDLCTPKQQQKFTENAKTLNGHISNNDFNCPESDKSDLSKRLCVFMLDISQVLVNRSASWDQCSVQPNAPSTLALYSLIEARGELIVFGGMRDSTTANPFLHVNSANEPGFATNCTYFLKPNYFHL
uniref:F-box domain-containing protein n=1 Tax=Panagrolaimus sp. JU765 TaxID=591449 RepID=A0AC34PUA3_9BILA